MLLFIIWDIIFTKNGVWGFNNEYLLGINLLELPIEEWLFFIFIPYACIFTHFALLICFPKLFLPKKITISISLILLLFFSLITILSIDKWYTVINFSYGIILLLIVLTKNVKLLQTYLPTFLVMLIPFFIVNGVLTGSFIENEVVWYNNDENLGIRIGTIPVEDIVYAFTLILTSLFLMTLLKQKSLK